MKKTVVCLLVFALMLTPFATAYSADKFSDVTSAYSWAKEAIEDLTEANMLTGYPDGTYKPGNSVTKQEAITLLARAIGFNNDANSWVVDIAYNKYQDIVSKYTTYAKKEAAYLLYKGILQVSDLQTYIGNAVYNTPLKRYEAAILITKVLGGQKEVDNMISIIPYYSDHADIPANAMGYVEYVRTTGIMQGVDGNKFAPANDITRAQIAVILQRIILAMSNEYISGTVQSFDINTSLISIKTPDGNVSQFNINKDVSFYLDGTKIAITAIEPGLGVVVTCSNGKLISIDAQTVYSDESSQGVFISSVTDNSGTTVRIMAVGGTQDNAKNYKASENVVINFNGKTATFASFEQGDFVKFEIKNNKIVLITGEEKGSTLSGVLEEIVFEPQYRLKVRDANNQLHELPTVSNVSVTRNGEKSNLRSLAVGDKLAINLEYNIVVSVTATSQSRVIDGTIDEITISKTPSIKVKRSSGEVLSLSLSRDVKIISDNSQTSDLYSLRLDQTVTVTLESNTVVKLEVKTPVVKNSLSGKVTAVNTSYGFIDIEITDATTMQTRTEKIFVKSNITIVDAKTGTNKALKDIKIGNNITATGTTSLGVFEATVIVIES